MALAKIQSLEEKQPLENRYTLDGPWTELKPHVLKTLAGYMKKKPLKLKHHFYQNVQLNYRKPCLPDPKKDLLFQSSRSDKLTHYTILKFGTFKTIAIFPIHITPAYSVGYAVWLVFNHQIQMPCTYQTCTLSQTVMQM